MNRECGNGGSKKWIEINLLVRVVSVVVVVVFVVVVVVVIIVVVVVVVIVVVVVVVFLSLLMLLLALLLSSSILQTINYDTISQKLQIWLKKYIEQMRSLME